MAVRTRDVKLIPMTNVEEAQKAINDALKEGYEIGFSPDSPGMRMPDGTSVLMLARYEEIEIEEGAGTLGIVPH